MPFLSRIVVWSMHHSYILLFGLIWVTTTAAAVTCVTIAIGRGAGPATQKARRSSKDVDSIGSQSWASTDVAMFVFLSAFLACYIALIIKGEAFSYYDDSVFTMFTLKGHNIQLFISREGGRFMPLAFQEFNLIRHFTDTIDGYHVFPIVQFLIVSIIFLFILDEISIKARVVLIVLVWVTPSILISFNALLFSERSVILFLACLMLSVKRFEQTRSITWALSAMISAQLMIYCKETAFLLLVGFACCRLILRCTTPNFQFGRLWVGISRLDMGLGSLAVLFLMFYFGVVGIPGHGNYAALAGVPRANVVLAYIKVDLLAWALMAVVLARLYRIYRHRVAPSLLWDGLAAGGVACFLGYIYLRMFSAYYPAPVDVIAVLYIGRLAVLSWKKIPRWGKAAAATLVVIIVLQDVLVSAFAVFERKNVIQGKVELASVVEARYRQGAGKSFRLFFPFSGGYTIMEFGAYLSSRGIPVEGANGEISGENSLVLAEARRTRIRNAPGRSAEDGPCVDWITIRCELVDSPAPGDLVIVLPDDEVSLAEVSVYREQGELLVSTEPRLSIPLWLHRLFNSLPVGPESRYRDYPLPDRWMDGSVTLWK